MSTGPGSQLFITRHARAIRVVSLGVFLLGVIVFVIYPSAREFSRALRAEGWARQTQLRFAWVFFLGGMTIPSMWGSFVAGFFPVFQTNVTRVKRAVLLVLSLLPPVFFLTSQAVASSEFGWPVIRTAIVFSMPGWVINSPAIFTGQPFLKVIWRVARALRLTSRDYAEWS